MPTTVCCRYKMLRKSRVTQIPLRKRDLDRADHLIRNLFAADDLDHQMGN